MDKKFVKLKFLSSELLYDIRNIAYVSSDIIPSTGTHYKHQLTDICEDGNKDQVNRIINLAIGMCKTFLGNIVCDPLEDGTAIDDTLKSPDTYEFNLYVPANTKKSMMCDLNNRIHQYVVFAVLLDWLGIIGPNPANPDAVNVWLSEKQKNEDEIKSYSLLSYRGHKLRQSPF